MVVVGADVLKRTHTFVVVDEVGRKLGEKVVAATTSGHRQALRWARERFGAQLVWAIEECRHLAARLEHDLLTADQKVVRVPSKLMAQTRASARTRGKSDPIDALAVARAFLREPELPIASHDEVSQELKLLVDRREDLVAQRTSTINRLLWRVHELDPRQAPKPRWVDLAKHRNLFGVNRFKTEAAFARHAGVAPIPVWSGNTAGRVRMTRSGNRQINAALHRIAVTQTRLDGLGKAYYRKRRDAGASKPEALRSLKRRLARVVFHHLHTDHQTRNQPCQPAAA